MPRAAATNGRHDPLHPDVTHRAAAVAAAVLVASFALAGCAGNDDPPPAEPSEMDGPTSPPSPDSGNQTPNEPERLTMYLTADGSLAPEPPVADTVDITVPASQAHATGGWGPAVFSTDAGPNGTWVVAEDARLQVWVQTSSPGAESYGIIGHLGTTRTVPIVASAAWPSMVEPGVPYELTVDLPFGTVLPLYAPPGEQILTTLSAIAPDGTSVDLLVGEDHPSSLSVTVREEEMDLTADVEPEQLAAFEGTLTGPGQFCATFLEGTSHVSYDLELPTDLRYLHVAMEQTGGSVQSDLDIGLYRGDERLGGGHMPSADDGIFLVGDTAASVAGETLELFIHSCHSLQTDFAVTAWTATGGPEEERM